MMDMSSSIYAGFVNSFAAAKIRTCFFHLTSNIRKLSGSKYDTMLQPFISLLHMCPSDNAFYIVSKLVYDLLMLQQLPTYAEAVKNKCSVKWMYWYIGSAPAAGTCK